jgi:CO/xanthine dehydrogenase Mo-binding subunit
MTAGGLPASLRANPRLSSWVRVGGDGTVTVTSGKVELGQGILTALAQIAAEELDVAVHRVRMVATRTDRSPNEGYTAGSLSLEHSGAALRQACAEVRAAYLHAAAVKLGVPVERLDIHDGVFRSPDGPRTSYWELADDTLLDRDATGGATPKPPGTYAVVGCSVERLDLPDKVTGRRRYIQDLVLPGLLHGRVLRPPSRGAELAGLDTTRAAALPGVVTVVRLGNFIGAVAGREEVALRAVELLRAGARWHERPTLPDEERLDEFLTTAPAETTVVLDEPGEPGAERTLSALYHRPYLAHASMAPSCGIALAEPGGGLSVWSHSQGVHHLRAELARVLDRPADGITVHHVEGAGCYGHNAAEDAALDAVLLARAVPGRPVKVVWSREDELSWAPLGVAAVVRLDAGIDASGTVRHWRHEIWGNGHGGRPGAQRAAVLLADAHAGDALPHPGAGVPAISQGVGAARNATPEYAFRGRRIIDHRLLTMPVRTSALRSLGAYLNVFAIESFMDELADAVGADPVEYRLRQLPDPRARAVVEAAAERAGWGSRPPVESVGYGMAFARYKNTGAYCAVVAEVQAEQEVRVRRLTLAVDAGLVVNPDGLVNQIEGGAIQATSWTVKERVRFDRSRVTSDTWETYPILRFSEVPAVDVVVCGHAADPSLGAGEAAQGPTAAAIANALHNAIGVRVRRLPLTPPNIIAAMA